MLEKSGGRRKVRVKRMEISEEIPEKRREGRRKNKTVQNAGEGRE